MDLALDGKLFGACIVVALVLFAFARVAQFATNVRGRAPHDGRLLRILETVSLPGAASLHVVRIGERCYAIGRSANYVAALCEVPAESVLRPREAPRDAAISRRTASR